MPNKSKNTIARKSDQRVNQADLALSYAKRGWAVFPVHTVKAGICTCKNGSSCGSPGKHPMTPAGFTDASKSRKQIRAWWKTYPKANIGIASGQSSGLLVLDLDRRNGGFDTLAGLEKELGSLPPTLVASTGGGGEHRLFRHPAFPVRKDNRGIYFGKGIDVLADGAYFIASASRHVSGDKYRWLNDHCIVDLPSAWTERLKKSEIDRLADSKKIPEGTRNDSLTRYAGKLRRKGHSEVEILQAVTKFNRKKCVPPLDKEEIAKIVRSVAKYEEGTPKDGVDELQTLAQLILDRHYHNGRHIIVGGDKQLWSYDGKVWRPQGEEILKRQVRDAFNASSLAGKRDAMPVVKQVVELIRLAAFRDDDPLSFKREPRPVINCLNGELWLRDDHKIEFRDHHFSSYQTSCLQVKWNPKAECPLYNRAVRKIFEKNRALVKFWNELVGYLIQPSRPVPLILILHGAGSNGKTALMRTVMRLLGEDMVAAQSIDSLSGNRFATAALVGKRILLDDDVRAGIKLPDGELKRLSEEKEISAERKHGAQFNFVVRTVPVLICNNTPSLADVSVGMQRRLLVVPFRASFLGNKADKTLFPKIHAEELEGVLVKSIRGFLRLSRRRLNFKRPRRVKRATDLFLASANPLPAFLKECCSRVQGASVSVQKLYQSYEEWAKLSGVTMTQQRLTFRRNLEHLGFVISRSNRGQVVKGIALRSLSIPPQ